MQKAYWILAILVMSLLLLSVIWNWISKIISDREFKKINKMHIEFMTKQLEQLDREIGKSIKESTKPRTKKTDLQK